MLKYVFSVVGLSMMLASFAPFAEASTTPKQLEPSSLASLAYQGYFSEQGIPSYGALISAHEGRRIMAEDLIRAAIADNRLSADALDNARYVRSVETQLRYLSNGHDVN